MLLSDVDIHKLIVTEDAVVPFHASLLQPASYELTWDGSFMEMRQGSTAIPTWDPSWDHRDVFDPPTVAYSGTGLISPGDFVLVSTEQKVKIPNGYAARVEGKSSLGRFGLAIHTTAGWIDPGFSGNITLELHNLSPRVLMIKRGQKICQLAFFQMTGLAEKPYGHPELNSAYQNQKGVTGSKGTRG